MNWSVHQYQKPMIAEPKRAPYQGKALSCESLIRVVIVSPYSFTLWAEQVSIITPQPPSSLSPRYRITSEPIRRMGVWRTDVLSTLSIPPMTV